MRKVVLIYIVACLFFLSLSACENVDSVDEYEQLQIEWENKVREFKGKHQSAILYEDIENKFTYELQEKINGKRILVGGSIRDIYIKDDAYYVSLNPHTYDGTIIIAKIEQPSPLLDGDLPDYSSKFFAIDVNSIEKVNLFYTADTEYEDEEVSAIIDVEDYNTRIIKGSLVDFIIEW